MKTFDVRETNERIMPASGLAIVGAILNKFHFIERFNARYNLNASENTSDLATCWLPISPCCAWASPGSPLFMRWMMTRDLPHVPGGFPHPI